MSKREREGDDGGGMPSKKPLSCQLGALQCWWSQVWEWDLADIAPGKLVKMFDLRSLSILRGPDERLSSLYVRRCFPALYDEIQEERAAKSDWLCHLNGNSGVGKSAFLWYFITRMAVESKLWNIKLHILYESSGYLWEFKDKTVEVGRRGSFPESTFLEATWHLINQQIPGTGAIGPAILLAASPEKSNIKPAKGQRRTTVVYMYPWEEDEYGCLVDLWKAQYDTMAAELRGVKETLHKLQVQMPITKEFPRNMVIRLVQLKPGIEHLAVVPEVLRQVDELLEKDGKQPGMNEVAEDLVLRLEVLIAALEQEVQIGLKRVQVAGDYYKWFGGVVRLLWSEDNEFLSEKGFATRVNESLGSTNLLQALHCMKEAWALLHFLKPEKSSSFKQYYLDFCSDKVKAAFTQVLTRMRAEELQLFMKTATEVPQFGVLRGFVFEELSIVQVLHTSITMIPMVDDKHCNKCKCREGKKSKGNVKWIGCDVCEHWYHVSCVRVTTREEMQLNWKCSSCEGKKREVVVEPKLLLRYYQGSLKDALLEAGADAVNYVWRPLIKNNAAVDYTILPMTLAQPTLAERHPISAEALKTHIDALRAWNEIYGTGTSSVPAEFVLCFFLAEENYARFGFQSYRDKSRRVTKQAVKGIRQRKVLLKHNIPLHRGEDMDIPEGVMVVDDIDQCKFDGGVCESNYFDPDEQILRFNEKEMNENRKWAV